MNAIELQDFEIDLEMLSDEQFDVNEAALLAETIISAFNSQEHFIKDRINCDFNDDCWVLPNEKNDSTTSFNFKEIRSNLSSMKLPRHMNIEEIILRTKCWIANRLEKMSLSSTALHLNNLTFLIKKTNFFHIKKVEELVEYLRDTQEKSLTQKVNIISTTMCFLDYNGFDDIYDEYDKLLSALKFNPKSKSRSLPPPIDILIFDSWVEKFYQDELKKGRITPLLIRYLPVVIWWKLTIKIPLRPIEFCHLDRNALEIYQDATYYLHLPRKKTKDSTKIQIIDKVWIDEELRHLIEHYLSITDNLGETETLISWRATASVYLYRVVSAANIKKLNPNRLTTSNFKMILENFYNEVLGGIYGLKVPPASKKELDKSIESGETFDFQRQIHPGDPRHIAIMTMVAQKWHPIEIARLAGHKTLSSYYHYSNHGGYWVDFEVQKLMMDFQKEKSSSKEGDYGKSQILWKEIIQRALYKAPTDIEFKEEKEIGYCTDKLKRCFTNCILCEHWRITFEEFQSEKVQNRIQDTILEYTKQATNLYTDIFNIIKAFDVDKYSEINPEIKNALDEKLMHFNAVVQNIAKIKQIEGDRMDNEQERTGCSQKRLQ